MSKKGTSICPIYFLTCDRQNRFSQNERRRADLQTLPQNFLFFYQDFQSLLMILPSFFLLKVTLKDHNKVAMQKIKISKAPLCRQENGE